MQLLIYASPDSAIGRDLEKRIRTLQLEIPSTYCTSLMALAKLLRKPMELPSIGIILLSNEHELTDLIGMRHLLRDMRLIVVLPGSSQTNISHAQAHLLRPRFITYADKNLEEVTDVLWKMKTAVHHAAS